MLHLSSPDTLLFPVPLHLFKLSLNTAIHISSLTLFLKPAHSLQLPTFIYYSNYLLMRQPPPVTLWAAVCPCQVKT